MNKKIEQILKATGMTEQELAMQILKANEETVNYDQPVVPFKKSDEDFAMNDDMPNWKTYYKKETKPRKGLVTPEDNGYSDLKRLGLWIKENQNADEERNKKARESIAKSWNDYRDSTDPMFRVGLVNAIFGDNSGLNAYYQMQNSNAEAQKNRDLQAEQARLNREAQASYNATFKAIEEANAKREQQATDRKRALEIMNKGEGATSTEKLELEQILDKYENDELNLNDLRDRARQQAATDLSYAEFIGEAPRNAKTDDEWTSWLRKGKELYAAYPEKLLEIQKKYNNRGESQSEADARTIHQSGLSHGISVGQKESDEQREINKEKKKLADAGRKKLAMKPPKKLTKKEKDAIDEGY